MKVGDLVQFKKVDKGGVQKQGVVLKIGTHNWSLVRRPEKVYSAKVLWNHPSAGVRWAQVSWLEVISIGDAETSR